MNYARRTKYDTNLFFVECRVAEDVELKYRKTTSGNVAPYVRFFCVTNSSPYSNATKANFYLDAYGKQAERIAAMLFKGVGIWVQAELVNFIENTKDASLKKTMVERFNCFRVKHIHIISVPDQQAQNETFTDVFYGLEEDDLQDQGS